MSKLLHYTKVHVIDEAPHQYELYLHTCVTRKENIFLIKAVNLFNNMTYGLVLIQEIIPIII